jgi:hypothetical protein
MGANLVEAVVVIEPNAPFIFPIHVAFTTMLEQYGPNDFRPLRGYCPIG